MLRSHCLYKDLSLLFPITYNYSKNMSTKTKWNGDLDIGSMFMCMLLSILKWCINIIRNSDN